MHLVDFVRWCVHVWMSFSGSQTQGPSTSNWLSQKRQGHINKLHDLVIETPSLLLLR